MTSRSFTLQFSSSPNAMRRLLNLSFLVAVLLTFAGSASAQSIILDDAFDDGSLGINSATGAGFVTLGQQAASELGGAAVLATNNPATSVIQSSDAFDPFSGGTKHMVWSIRQLSPTLPVANYRTFVGIRPASNTADHLGPFGTEEGFYIAINSSRDNDLVPTTEDFHVVWTHAGTKTILAEGAWDSYNGSGPLDVALTVSGNDYTVQLSETVTLSAGALSGTLPSSPGSASYAIGASHQVHFTAGGSGSMHIESIRVVNQPEFTALSPFSSLGIAYAIDLGDYDKDGDQDVFWGIPGADKKLLRNDGAGGLTEQFSFPTASGLEGTSDAEFADFNGDSYPDVVFVNGNLRSIFTPSQGRVFINNRDGTFTEQWVDGDTDVSGGVTTGDFNGDGRLDYAVANRNGGGSSKVWLNNGPGGPFGFTQASVPTIVAEGVDSGDLDGDGDTDLVFSNGVILYQTGSGFNTATIAVGSGKQYVSIAQMDGADGADLVFSGDRLGQVRVFLENGMGGYDGQAVVGNTTDVRFDAEVADIDNDGDPDLIVVGYGAGFDAAFLNDGSGRLVPAGGLGFGDKGLGIGDIDGDGDTDVVTSNVNAVFRNDSVTLSPLEVRTTEDSGAHSLRSAILYANATAGLDNITFNIPGSGPHLIAPKTALPLITDAVVIDGCTQPGSMCAGAIENYNLEVVLQGAGLPQPDPYIDTNNGLLLTSGSGGTTVRGLVINGFGGKGLRVDSPNNIIERNFIGTDVSGAVDLGVISSCVELRSAASTNNTVRFNLLSGCDYAGVLLYAGATGNTVEDNYIGTTADGAGSLANTWWAVHSDGASGNTIRNNVLGGPVSTGGEVLVAGNYIGRSAAGDPLAVRGGTGVVVYGDDNRIGGTSPGEGNTFGALSTAIRVQTGSGNQIRQNAMDATGGTGIELVPGANADLQPPTVNSVYLDGGDLQVSMSGLPASSEVEVFRTRENRQIGEEFLGNVINVVGAGSAIGSPGNAAALSISAGDFVTVTVTDAAGNTSGFSSEVEVAAAGSPLVVTSPNNSGPGSLRSAIDFANTNPGADPITFALPPPFEIALTAPLPAISDPVIIDGFSQPGASANTAGAFDADDAVRLVQLDGSGTPQGTLGLEFEAAATGSRVSGLDIFGFKSAGVLIRSDQTQVSGNRIHANGSDPGASLWTDGVLIDGGSQVTVGGPNAADRNVLTGNTGSGVGGVGTSALVVQGNFIGLEEDGLTPGGNSVGFAGYSHQDIQVLDNVIAANTGFGMELAITTGTLNRVSGNRIGTSADGTQNRGNGQEGILVWKSTLNTDIEDNRIGFNAGPGIRIRTGAGAAPENIQLLRNEVISHGTGISIEDGGSGLVRGNVITDNNTGLSLNAVGDWDIDINTVANNTGNGLEAFQPCASNLGCAITGNLVYGNGDSGVFLEEQANGYLISGNRVGIDAANTAAPNLNGVIIRGGSNQIGPANTISGNDGAGLMLTTPRSTGNVVRGNFIGTNPAGETATPNLDHGVAVTEGAWGNLIGGVGAMNVISGNRGHGVFIEGSRYGEPTGPSDAANNNTVSFNHIGVDIHGNSPVPNGDQASFSGNGVMIDDGPHHNTVDSNLISSNLQDGVMLLRAGDGNSVTNNKIGTAIDGESPLPNQWNGIDIIGDDTGGHSTITGNTIAFHPGSGVMLKDISETAPNLATFVSATIRGNAIYANERIGIDLTYTPGDIEFAGDLRNLNDALDTDVGPNGKQNYPTLISAKRLDDGTVTLDYTLTPIGSDITVEIFNSDADSEEGQSLLETTTVSAGSIVTGRALRVQFDGSELTLGDRLVATATADGKTSEFSLPLTVTDAIPRGLAALTVLGSDVAPVTDLTTVEAMANGDFLAATGSTVTRHTLGGSQSVFATVGSGVIHDVIARDAEVALVYSTVGAASVEVVGGATVSVPDATAGAVGPNGDLHVVAGTEILVGQGLNGPYLALSPAPTLPAGVIEYLSMTFGIDGSAFVGAATAAGGAVYILNASGELDLLWTLNDRPTSMDVAEDGRLYVTTPTQVLSGKPSQAAPTEFLALPGAGSPENSLAIGPNSRLFIGHQERGQVYRLSLPNSQDVNAALTFAVSDGLRNMIAGTDAAIAAAFDTWRNLAGAGGNISSQISFDAGASAPEVAAIGDMENSITLSDDPLFLGRSTLGVASKLLRVTNGNPEDAEVVTADILLNSRFHPTTGTSGELGSFTLGTSSKDHNVQNVVTHEVGHVLGLVHVGTPAGVMFYNLPKGDGTLTVDDRAAMLRKASDGTLDGTYGTIRGRVTSGRTETFGTAVGGAMVIATNTANSESVSAYTNRNGEYELSFLPQGTYQVGLFALDGSVFAAKIPLTPGRISRTLDTIANERDFLEEYWNGADESANDDRTAIEEIPVGAGSIFTADFITNIDTAPPTVANITVGENPDAASLNPTIGLTFSERIQASSASQAATVRRLDCAAPCATVAQLSVTLSKTGRKVAIAKSLALLEPGTAYVITIAGLIDDAGNVQAAPFSSVFSTRPEDLEGPSVALSVPADGATNVSASSLVAVTFSEALGSASVTTSGNVVLVEALPGGGFSPPVAGRVSIPASDVVAFSPSGLLTAGATYVLQFNDIEDVSGNVMPQTPVTFTVADDATSLPVLVDFGPGDSASDISRETQVFLDFSEPVEAAGAGFPVDVTGPGGSISVEVALINQGTRLVLTPVENLAPGLYSVAISPGIQDVTGNPVDLDPVGPGVQTTLTWSFTTVSDGLTVTLISPSTASIGSFVTIEGTGFNALGGNTVLFNGVSAPVESSTVTSVTVKVPDDATTGPVTVNGIGGVDFTLYTPPATFDTAVTKTDTGNAPSDVDVNPDGTLAVVTNSRSNTVSIIDVDSGEEFVAVVGQTPVRVVLTPDGDRAYVTNYNSHTVSVIDLSCAVSTGGSLCVDEIPVGFNPIGIDIAPDGSRVYVANYSSQSISIIDAIASSGTYNRAVRTLETDDAVTEVFTDPDGGVRYLNSEAGNSASDPNPDGTLKRLQADSNPSDVEASPDGTTIFIGTDFGVLVSEVDLERDQANWGVTVLVSESHPSATDLDPDGGVTKLGTDGAPSASNADPDGAGTIARTESTVSDVESSPDGAILSLVLGTGELLLYAVPEQPYTGEYQAVTKTGSDVAASEVETSPDGTIYYVTSFETSTVSIYRFGAGLGSEESDPLQVSGSDYGLVLIDVLQTGLQPQGLAYSPARDIAVVANSGSDDVTILSFAAGDDVVLEQDEDPNPDVNGDGIPDVRVVIAEQLADLNDLASGKDQKDYAKALKHAEKNLLTKIWTDALPSEKHGKKVFDNDKQIVKALEDVLERDGFGSDVAEFLLTLTLDLDRAIVTHAIDKAQADIDARVCANGKSGKKCRKQIDSAKEELEKAMEELADADAEIADGDFDKAVDQLKKAWDKAIKSQDDVAGKGFWEDDEDLPVEFALEQNYPNPFNPVTTVEFALPEMSEVRLEVFDVLGRRVQTLVNGPMDAGYHSVQFNAERLASGIYLYRIHAGAYTKVQRMVLMK